MDTVLFNDKPFLGIGGYGFDAHIAKMFDNYHKRGFWSYVKLVVKEFATFKPVKIELEINGKKETKNVFLCNIANASEFGNGFVISPNSDITDGQIELCFFKPFSPWLAPFVVRRFFKRTVHQSRYSEIIQVKKARLTLSKTLAHYDGEPFEVRKELNIQVIPKSLNILAGKSLA
jgi:diacylglycerol kinase family enzyme